MNGRFINDVVEFKCQDGKKRDAMIIEDSNDGNFAVAYVEASGCQNVKVHVEENIRENRLLGASRHMETILPYQVGDIVAYYIEPETYYLAHIVEIGTYNSVKILLGDLYMNGWIKDDKRGDIVVADVKDIRWDKTAAEADVKPKKRYGYEPRELRDPKWKQKLLFHCGAI